MAREEESGSGEKAVSSGHCFREQSSEGIGESETGNGSAEERLAGPRSKVASKKKMMTSFQKRIEV